MAPQDEEMLNLHLELAKYKGAMYGSVGGPIEPGRPGLVILTLDVGVLEGETPRTHHVALEFTDAKQLLYDVVRMLRTTDPISAQLYEAFKRVFEAQSHKEKE